MRGIVLIVLLAAGCDRLYKPPVPAPNPEPEPPTEPAPVPKPPQ